MNGRPAVISLANIQPIGFFFCHTNHYRYKTMVALAVNEFGKSYDIGVYALRGNSLCCFF